MQAEGLEPDKVTFVCIVDACDTVEALQEGRVIHATVAGKGWETDAVVGTALVYMYGKCGTLDDARAVFAVMPQRQVVSWSAMIAACAQNRHGKEALQLCGQMQAEGLEQNKITFISVVDACASVAALEEARVIHASVAGNAWELDIVVGTALINMYGKCRSLDDATAVFAEMPQRNVVSWSAFITALAKNGHGIEASELFGQMQAEGMELDKITFVCVVDACASVPALEEGRVIHSAITGNGWESDAVIGTALINLYGKCTSLDDARAVFEEVPQPSVVSWNTMIAVCAQNGHGKEALQLFAEMQARGFELDKVTFICAIDACASETALEEGRVIHSNVTGNGCELDVVVGTALVNMYGKCGSLDDARAVFAGMPMWNVISWSAMIAVCTQNGNSKEALQLFGQMQAKGFEPDKVTCSCVVDACASVAALVEGRMIHATIAWNGWELNVVVGNALVNFYGKCGSLDDVRTVFAEMPQRDVVSWSAMIAACAQNGHGKEAMQFFDQMRAAGVEPNKLTFTCILTACSHTGLVADGSRYFASMKRDHHITPSVEHHVCMIDLLGRRGLLEEAEELIACMPFENVPSAWLSLLASCRTHNDVERAVRAASYVFKLDPRSASSYVLLADIHANAGRWDDALRVRSAMIDKGVKKLPGHRCIESNNVVHDFVVRDTS